MNLLTRDGTVVATAHLSGSLLERSRGLLGKDRFEGALVLSHTWAVHTLGMRFPIDVAFCDKDMVVIDVVHMPTWRIGRPRRRATTVVESQAGSFERWELGVGDQLAVTVGRVESTIQ